MLDLCQRTTHTNAGSCVTAAHSQSTYDVGESALFDRVYREQCAYTNSDYKLRRTCDSSGYQEGQEVVHEVLVHLPFAGSVIGRYRLNK